MSTPSRCEFEVLFTPACSAAENMQTDIYLLESLKMDPKVILHIYAWKMPSATYGYFLDPSHYFRSNALENRLIDIARRPTGGGIIFHHCDLAFSLLIPSHHPGYTLNTLDNYVYVNSAVAQAVQNYLGHATACDLLQEFVPSRSDFASNFCMAKPTKYDVLLQGRKVGGGAQRRTRYGLLHQGSLCLYLPTSDFLNKVLLSSHELENEMHTFSWPLLGEEFNLIQFEKSKIELGRHLTEAFQNKFDRLTLPNKPSNKK